MVRREGCVLAGFDSPTFMNTTHPFERILLGPGPSPVPARAAAPSGTPPSATWIKQYPPSWTKLCERLRQVFRTGNPLTFVVSGTGITRNGMSR